MKLRIVFTAVLTAVLAAWLNLDPALAATLADEFADAEPGLYQKRLGASFDTTSDPVPGGTVVPGALVASCPGASYTHDGTTYSMASATTWAYKGYMHMEGQTTYHFVKNYDDNGLVRITSPANVTTEVLNCKSWGNITIRSYTAPETGWYIIDLRVGNGGGGMGPVAAPFNSASQLGAGLAWNAEGITTCTTANYGSWRKFMNTGEETLFYTGIPETADFTILPIPVQYIAGGSAEPPLVVSNRITGAILQQGADKDYTVSYTNNTSTGRGKAIVTGVNSYAGQSADRAFAVIIMSQDGYVETDASALLTICGNRRVYAFTNTVAALKLTALQTLTLEQALVVGGGKGTVLDFDPNTVLETDTEIQLSAASASAYASTLTLGAATHTAAGGTSGPGTDSFITGELVKYGTALGPGTVILAFSVGDTSASRLQVDIPEYAPYGGSAVEPAVTVRTADGTLLAAGTDYTVSYVNNTSPGTAAVLVTGKDGTAAEGLTETRTFTITQVYFASRDGTTSATGASWDDPMAPQTALTAAAAADSAGTPAEVRFKSGIYTNTATLTATRPMVIRGGYLGAGGTSDALDEACPETVFSGNTTLGSDNITTLFSVTAAVAGRENLIERCAFGHARDHGFNKSGASTLKFAECRFFNNGWNYSAGINGRGLYAVGTAAAELILEDCEFTGNRETQGCLDPGRGFGAYFSTFRRVTVDNCLFLTNGWNGANGRTAWGAAFYATDAPLTCRNSVFKGNQLSGNTGEATVFITGAGGGSAFTNCLFAGNAAYHYGAFGNGSSGGAVCAQFSTADQTVDFDHCTFAYNLSGATPLTFGIGPEYYDYSSAAGITVQRGTAKVRNSIFYGNSVCSASTSGADMYVHAGSLDVDYCLVGGLDPLYISGFAGTALSIGDHMVVGEPDFVTTTNVIKDLTDKPYKFPKSDNGRTEMSFKNTAEVHAALCAIDVHVLSKAGYRMNGMPAGTYLTDTELYSRAIDASDPSAGVVGEAAPNGGTANLGCYGNTAEASKSCQGVPTLGAIVLTFPDGYTCPEIAFSVGGNDVPFTGLARVFCGTGTLAQAGTDYQWTREYAGVRQGDSFDWFTSAGILPGEVVHVMVTLSSPGNPTLTNTVSLAATGLMPPWQGHGGDPAGVVHVRVGSRAERPQGTSWTDAFPDLASANFALGETRNQIWLAGEIIRTTTPLPFVLAAPATIRGGFTGTEDSPGERAEGAVSTLNGSGECVPLKLSITQAITLERVRFTGGYPHAVWKTDCPGDIAFHDCEFLANTCTPNSDVSGACIYFDKSYYNGNVVVSRCRFEGNGRAGSANTKTLYGGCIHINSQKSLTLDNCTFITNGVDFGVSTHGTSTSGTIGSCLYANATPCYITNCRFIGNRSSCYTTSVPGGTLYFAGACGGSYVRNCVFVGNECVSRADQAANGGTMAGTIVVNLNELIRTLDIENCTFAWNLTSGLSSPVDICAHVGTVGIRNSIFRGGVPGGATVAGVGKYCDARANGVINADYCMFDGDPTNCVGNYGGGAVSIGGHCSNADPSFVTGDTFISNNVTVFEPEGVFAKYTPESLAALLAADVHLVSAGGYYDNAGGFHDGGTVFSKAIDAGDPASDFSSEPVPNGGFINLGAYGNTPEASMTVVVQPEILNGQVDVTFPDGTSLPQIAFSFVPSQFDYTAIVNIYCGTGALAQAGTAYSVVSPNLPIRAGDAFSWLSRTEPYEAGETLYVMVVVTSGDNAITNFTSANVEGDFPAWYGKGGGAGVIHVWADAPGDRTGANWQHAYPTLDDAVTNYDGTISEIWICGDYEPGATPTFNVTNQLVIRGGFAACENTPEERPAGTRAMIDAKNTYDPLKIVNSAAGAVTLERLVLINGKERAITKTGAGDLTILDCQLLTNGVNAATGSGKGINVSDAPGARILFRDTLFRGNRLILSLAGKFGNGCGAYITGCAGAVFEHCDFIGNGLPLLRAETGVHSGNPQCFSSAGFALYSSVPVSARNCRFLANFGNANDNDGAVRLESGAAGSAFTNCLFAANAERSTGDRANRSTSGGALVVNLTDAEGEVGVENCTFAYNLQGGSGGAAGLTAWKGTVTVRNSIFFGNFFGERARTGGRDLLVRPGATCNVSYSLFSEDSTNSLCALDGGTLNVGPGVIYGDPNFVTPLDTISSLVQIYRSNNINYIYFDTAESTYGILEGINCHLRGKAGYWDETTGELVVFPKAVSPALDAGDPASDYRNEPKSNGRRINLGFYGNTPWATLTPVRGSVLILR